MTHDPLDKTHADLNPQIKPTPILTISTHSINNHTNLDPLRQDHAAKPPDNARPRITLEKWTTVREMWD